MKFKPDLLTNSFNRLLPLGGKIGDSEFTLPAELPLPRENILSAHSSDMLLNPPNNATEPRILLADSIEKLANSTPTPQEEKIIRGIIEYDAEKLAARILPPEEVRLLELGLPAGSDGASLLGDGEPEQEVAYSPPTLNDVLLLAYAYDATTDIKLAKALDFILDNSPPQLSDMLEEALETAELTGGPVIPEYQRIMAEESARVDAVAAPEERAIVALMRQATIRKIPHLERQIRESKSDSGDTPHGTGVIS